MKINLIPDGSGTRKTYCPICILSGREVPMPFSEKEKTNVCNFCHYIMPRHLNPVETPKLLAGNEEEFNKPWSKSVSFARKLKIRPDQDTFGNPVDAWNDL